jgi:hypothetical protein
MSNIPIPLTIKMLDGKTFNFEKEITGSTTIAELLTLIANKSAIFLILRNQVLFQTIPL